jgi:hypothetical protein
MIYIEILRKGNNIMAEWVNEGWLTCFYGRQVIDIPHDTVTAYAIICTPNGAINESKTISRK